MNNKTRALACGLAGLLAAAPAVAVTDFGFADIAYIEADFDADGERDADGFAAELALPIGPAFFLTGEYSTRETDDDGGSIQFDVLSAGLGLQGRPFGTERLTAFFAATYERIDVEVTVPGLGPGDEDFSGFGAQLGFRVVALDWLELHGRYKRTVIDEEGSADDTGSEDDDVFRIGAVFEVTPGLGLTADFDNYRESDLEEYHLGVRWMFGAR